MFYILLIVLNFSWYIQSQASTPTVKDTDAKNSIRQFYSFVVNGVICYNKLYFIQYFLKIKFTNVFFLFCFVFICILMFFSQMDVRFKTIQASYTISILYAGIYIADVCMLKHIYARYKLFLKLCVIV